MAWYEDMTWSARLFTTQVWPEIANIIGGGQVISVESQTDEMRKRLDISSGIDYWQLLPIGMRGIASRIQVAGEESPFNTFTVRLGRDTGSDTEWKKRKYAVETEGILYPWYTIQAYVESKHGNLQSAAIIRTRDLVNYVKKSMPLPPIKRCENASFIVCDWDDIKATGYQLHLWSRDNN